MFDKVTGVTYNVITTTKAHSSGNKSIMKMRFRTHDGGVEYTSDEIINTLTIEQLRSAQTLIARKSLEIPRWKDNNSEYDHQLILKKLTDRLEQLTLETLTDK